MADGEDDLDISLSGDEPLELDNEVPGDEAEDHAGDDGDDGGETVIAFADEGEEQDDDTPLVKKLRQQLREEQRRNAQLRKAPANDDADPEPVVPEKPKLEAFDYDQDKFDAAVDAREARLLEHAEWKRRQDERKAARERTAEQQAQQIEQQRKSLGVSDYEERAALVRDRLNDQQLALLTNGSANPAKLIYALGRSPSKLDQLAGEENLARFLVMVGSMERDIKVTKRNAPAVDTPVRGATASPGLSDRAAKELKKLEAEAARTGDRTKLIRFRKSLSKAA